MKRLLQLWTQWSSQTTNRRIFAAATAVSLAKLLVSIAHIGRELAVAGEFGRTEAVDAFLIAFLLPAYAINVVGGALRAAFIPVYVGVREREGQEEASKLLQTVSVLVVGCLSAAALGLALVGDQLLPLLGSGFSPATLELTGRLFRALLPAMVVIGLSRIWAGTLNAHGSFLTVEVAPIFVPLLGLAFVLLLAPQLGISALVYAVLAGAVAEAALLAVLLRRQRLPVVPRWHPDSQVLSRVGSQTLMLAAGAAVMSSTTVVDQGMAAMLAPGSVAALGYGDKVPRLLLNLGALSLGTAALPFLSEMVARRDSAAIRHTLKHFTRLVLLLSVPAVLALAAGSTSLAALLFERGAFTAADTAIVGRVQALYLLQVPFYVVGILLSRVLISLGAGHVLLLIALVSFIVNVVGNLLLMRWMGLPGIALSTSIVYLVSTTLLTFAAFALLRGRAPEPPAAS